MVSVLDQITVMCSNGSLFATEMTVSTVCISLVVFSHVKFLKCKVKFFCLVNKQTCCPRFKKYFKHLKEMRVNSSHTASTLALCWRLCMP